MVVGGALEREMVSFSSLGLHLSGRTRVNELWKNAHLWTKKSFACRA